MGAFGCMLSAISRSFFTEGQRKPNRATMDGSESQQMLAEGS